jgi:hypothetical protein
VKGYNWEIIATSWDTPEQVSFVNGVSTILGGKHVDYVLNQITKKASDLINKRNKDANVKPQHVKDKLFLILKSTIPNPSQRPDEGDSGHAGDEVPEEDRSFGQVRGRPVKNTLTSPSWPVLWRRPPNRKL